MVDDRRWDGPAGQPGERAPTGVFVGRAHELAILRGGLEQALTGRGGLFLLAGEAGIGKSRLIEEIGREARQRGAALAVGRCWEAGGAPAYWPWLQVIRSLFDEERTDHPGAVPATTASNYRQLLGELGGSFSVGARPDEDPALARFQLFESVVGQLRDVATRRTVFLGLDDLHVADTPALLLLRFLASELADAGILVVASYRDTEVNAAHPLTAAIADVVRHPTTRVLRLAGLDEPEVERVLAAETGRDPAPALARLIHEKTGGNALFVVEVARLAAAGTAELMDDPKGLASLPGVREVIAHRLAQVPEDVRLVLAAASVMGREFELATLARLTGMSAANLLPMLDAAAAAGVVADVPETVGRMRFSHVLVRDALYGGLPNARRIALHLEAGKALERRYAADREAHLSELAHHFVSAAAASDPSRAVDYAHRAGRRAVRQLAYEEAVRLFHMALDALEMQPRPDPAARCELLLELGDAEARVGNAAAAKAAFLDAADVARGIAASRLLARAAIGYGGRFLWARAGSDPHLIPLLEEALEALVEADDRLRVMVMARLAGALRDQHDGRPRDRLSRDAVELARRIGDPIVLGYALDARCFAIFRPDNPDERLAIAEELIQLAESSGDSERAASGRFVRGIAVPLELGSMQQVNAELEALAGPTAELRQPAQRWVLTASRATVALFEGRFEDAEPLIEEALRLGSRAQESDAVLTHRIQRFTLHMQRGGLGDLETIIRRSIVEYPSRPMFRCMLAYLLVASGREGEARAIFDAIAMDRFALLPMTNEWLFSLAFLTDVAGRLGDVERATTLLELQLPYAHRNACTPDYIATGSVSRTIGVAAATAERWPDAERYFRQAYAANCRMGAKPWIGHTLADWAEMLIRRDGPGDRERAVGLARQAADLAVALGMEPLASRAGKAADRAPGHGAAAREPRPRDPRARPRLGGTWPFTGLRPAA